MLRISAIDAISEWFLLASTNAEEIHKVIAYHVITAGCHHIALPECVLHGMLAVSAIRQGVAGCRSFVDARATSVKETSKSRITPSEGGRGLVLTLDTRDQYITHNHIESILIIMSASATRVPFAAAAPHPDLHPARNLCIAPAPRSMRWSKCRDASVSTYLASGHNSIYV